MKQNSRKFNISMFLIYFLISIIYVFSGQIHLDEGAYLYAANAVYHGKLLYKDFFFLQPPIHPFIYGFIQQFSPSLITGRLTSTFLGFFSLLLLLKIQNSITKSFLSNKILLLLVTSNLFQIYFYNITRLYALTSFFLYLGIYFLFKYESPSIKYFLLAVFMLSIAIGTRITILPVFYLSLFYIIYKLNRKWTRLFFLCISFLFVFQIFSPFLFSAGIQRIWFNLLGMNMTLYKHNFRANFFQKIHATSQLVRYYYFSFLLLIPAAVNFFRNIRKNISWNYITRRKSFLWIIVISTLSVHSVAKIYQVSYQVIIMPLLILLISIDWSNKVSLLSNHWKKIIRTTFIAGCALTALSYGTQSISLINNKPAYFALKDQTEFVKNHSNYGDKIFSADSSLVPVCADRDILKGMAGSDLFPEWSTQKCEYFNVLNFSILKKYIMEQRSPILIIGDTSFSLSLPYLDLIPKKDKDDLLRVVEKYYLLQKTFPNLYIKGTSTHYYLRKVY